MRAYAGYLFILLAALLWGLIGPVARFSLASGLEAAEIAFWRAGIGGSLFLIHAGLAGSLGVHRLSDFAAFALFGALAIGGLFASNLYAVENGGASLASVLLYTAPAWVAVLSRLFFGERLSLVKASAIGMSLAGIVCISLPEGVAFMQAASDISEDGKGGHIFSVSGMFSGLMAGFLYATHYLFSKKYLCRYSAYTIYGYAMLFGAISLLPLVEFKFKGFLDWSVLFFIGLVCTYFAYWAYCEGMKRLAPTRASVLATLEPLVATWAAWLLWGEMFTFFGWLGVVLVLSAVVLLVTASGKESGQPRTGL